MYACVLLKPKMTRPWKVLVVGRDDGIGFDLKSRVKLNNLCENFIFLGARKDVDDLLQCSDVGVLCSHQEGFSNSVLEGMAAGLPMVVTDVGGNSEAVQDHLTGYVVPSGNVEMLFNALLSIAGNPQRKVMGDNGKKKGCRKFFHGILR